MGKRERKEFTREPFTKNKHSASEKLSGKLKFHIFGRMDQFPPRGSLWVTRRQSTAFGTKDKPKGDTKVCPRNQKTGKN